MCGYVTVENDKNPVGIESAFRHSILEDAGGCSSTKKPARLVFKRIRGLFEVVVRIRTPENPFKQRKLFSSVSKV